MSKPNTYDTFTPAAYVYSPCHTDGAHVLTIGHCTIHASGSRHSYDSYALVLNLTGWHHGDREFVTASPTAQKLVSSFYRALPVAPKPKTPVVVIDWPDGGIPDLDKSDWMRLIGDLSKIKGKVLIHCVGGHGRTGTAFAALLFLSRAIKGDPVKWLRTQYCAKVVESESQIKYLKKLGVPVTVEPRYLTPAPMITWPQTSFIQEQYELTKPNPTREQIDHKDSVQILYQCILCKRKHIAASFYQTFLDMTGFCWSCHQLSHTTNGDELHSS